MANYFFHTHLCHGTILPFFILLYCIMLAFSHHLAALVASIMLAASSAYHVATITHGGGRNAGPTIRATPHSDYSSVLEIKHYFGNSGAPETTPETSVNFTV